MEELAQLFDKYDALSSRMSNDAVFGDAMDAGGAKPDRIHMLAVAGALIAAEIDRLRRQGTITEHELEVPAVKDIPNWKAMAIESLTALRLFSDMFEELRKNNKGFLGKLYLPDIALLNTALMAEEQTLRRYRKVSTPEWQA